MRKFNDKNICFNKILKKIIPIDVVKSDFE